jgi:hypothetical protein
VIILSKGFLRPETGDPGDIWFPAMEDNIEQLDIHNHDGVNSQLLTAGSSLAVTQTILAASWVLVATDSYRQLVTLPVLTLPLALSYDTCSIEFRLSNGDRIYPTVERVSSTQFYVYVSDNTLSLKAVYTT